MEIQICSQSETGKESCCCNKDEIVSAVIEQLPTIREGETFRVTVEKRRNAIASREIIDSIATRVPRKVELEHPSKIVMIEIIGDLAGVSVLRPTSVFGVEKEKRTIASQLLAGRSAR